MEELQAQSSSPAHISQYLHNECEGWSKVADVAQLAKVSGLKKAQLGLRLSAHVSNNEHYPPLAAASSAKQNIGMHVFAASSLIRL